MFGENGRWVLLDAFRVRVYTLEYKHLPDAIVLALAKLKAFADDKFSISHNK